MAVFKDLDVTTSYTFEASFNGSEDKDDFEMEDYEQMGVQFIQILGNYLVRKNIVSSSSKLKPNLNKAYN